jgi:hypothetical protein
MAHYKFQFLSRCSRAGDSDLSVAFSFSNSNEAFATSEGPVLAPFSIASVGLASVGAEGPTSAAIYVMPTSVDFFIFSPSTLGASTET